MVHPTPRLDGYVVLRQLDSPGTWRAVEVLNAEDDPVARLLRRMEAARIPGRWAVAELRMVQERDWRDRGQE